MVTQNYIVNLKVGGGISPIVKLSQGDVGRELVFSLYDGAVRFTPPSGATVKIKGTKPSGLGFNEACTLSGSVARVFTTLAMTQEGGKIPAELEITNGSVVIGSANFTMYVEPSPHPDGTTDGTHATVNNLQTQIGNLANLATTAKTNLVSAINEAAQSGGVVIDDTLTQTGAAADSKKTGDEIASLKADLDDLDDRVEALEAGGSGSGLTEGIKTALLAIFQKVAYVDDDGKSYYDDLHDALYPPAPPASLTSITAVYTQSGTVYDTDTLNDLKSDLVVTAHYSDSTTGIVTDYTLSGTLTAGTSTITVTYGGKTTTFTVTVTSAPTLTSISAVYTQSGTVYDTDTLDSLKPNLVVTAHYSDSTTQAVTNYVLSGTLTVGTSTITVTYSGKTTTFTVTVTERQTIHITYTQGSIGAGNTDANRVSGVITSDIHFDDGESMVISVASGYSVYPFGIYTNADLNSAGTKASTNNVLNAYVVSDSSYVVQNIGAMSGTLYANTKSLNNKGDAGWMTDTIAYTFTKTSEYGYTFTGLGFLVKKNNNANITPSDIEPLITITKTEA